MPATDLRAATDELLDVLADRSVLIGYSRLGYRLRSRTWPADDPAPGSLAGRTAVVTGASSGLGQATAERLASLGARVVLLVRNEERGLRTREAIRRAVPESTVDIEWCDVADLLDVDRCAARMAARFPVLDVLVHNAGVLPAERAETAQGHELTLATHVLGPLRLTERLRPALAASRDARVIWMSSGGMYTQPLPEDLEYRDGRYRGAVAYSRTKRLQVAFAGVLARRFAADGIGVHTVHPGWADTPGVAESLPGFHRLLGALLRTPAEGADTAVWLAATAPAPEPGRFWHDRRPRPVYYLPWQHDDPDRLRRAWDRCAAAAGLSGDGPRS
ncbi:SDR family NAD(P)-dependent oxidoreductase [Amycolatopsis benzoatilytica]|uniref:SDR family NAD(P)-dependent oxidoreductase n=1 Tax=Amycolatopsis benzoatilytica TaxID=346045 RepID=UPI0003625E9E|nr:SDR family NAD(P)-dependent oxidoreductase [Amycolatopsis benzoatilytica]